MGIAMAEASLLAESTLLERQNSFSDNIVRAFTGTNNAPDQHFVATALYFEPVNNSRRSVAPNILNDGNNNRNFNSAVQLQRIETLLHRNRRLSVTRDFTKLNPMNLGLFLIVQNQEQKGANLTRYHCTHFHLPM